MNGSNVTMWPSLLPPVCDPIWFTADYPKNEEAELAMLEEELKQEEMALKEQTQDWINIERTNVEQIEEDQEYDETDDSYMGDAASDDVDVDPQSPPW